MWVFPVLRFTLEEKLHGKSVASITDQRESENLNILFNDNLPTDLYTAFQIIKLLIEKRNLNLIHNKNSYQHFNYLSRKRKLDKLYNEM